MLDGQTLDGNGATMIWNAEPEYASDGVTIKSAPHIIDVKGSLIGDPINILEKPTVYGNPASGSYGSSNQQGFVQIKVAANPLLYPGDRIAIQAARAAHAPESGAYWCGTPTGTAAPTYWAEILTVNDVKKTGTNVWTIRCIGTLVYPYYLTGPEEGVDIARQKVEVRTEGTNSLVGYSVLPDVTGADGKPVSPLWCRDCSTIQKIDFLRDVTIRDLNVEANCEAHSGNTAGDKASFKGDSYGNTIYLSLCEGAVVENVRLVLTDIGRGIAMSNCLRSVMRDCSYETKYTIYGAYETHTYTNAFTFASCWACTAEGCRTLRAGQSFDNSYAGEIRCPSLFLTIRGCTVEESMDSALTNHSGCWGETIENCRFLNCARPVAIRSPMTTLRGCVFAGHAGNAAPTEWDPEGERYSFSADAFHLHFAEPTIFGCIVEGCTFTGGKAIYINPYELRAFNYVKGNYLEGEYSASRNAVLVPDGTVSWPYGPERKNLGIQIRGNTFNGCQNALWLGTTKKWNFDANGNLTEYAKRDMGVTFEGNVLLACGKNFWPIYLEAYWSGCRFDRNHFADCASDAPAYYSGTGAKKYVRTLIYMGVTHVRNSICDNVASRCGGDFQAIFSRPDAADLALGTNGSLYLTASGNRVLDSTMTVEPSGSDTEVGIISENTPRAERLLEYQGTGDPTGTRMGHAYDFDAGRADTCVSGEVRVSVDVNSVYGPRPLATAECLLRGWCYLYPGVETTAVWRSAVYDYEMDAETFRRICACWDAGEDEQGNAVTFASPVVLDDGPPATEEEAHTVVWVTYQPPINKDLTFLAVGDRYIGANSMYQVDRTTGNITVNVPQASAPAAQTNILAFAAIPNDFTPILGHDYSVCIEVKDNHTGSGIRADSNNSSNTPGVFRKSFATPKGAAFTTPAGEPGQVTVWNFKHHPAAPLDLGTADAPWKDVYAGTLTLGQTQVSEAQLTALLALLD